MIIISSETYRGNICEAIRDYCFNMVNTHRDITINPYTNLTLCVDAKLEHFRNGQIYFYSQNSFPYSADV